MTQEGPTGHQSGDDVLIVCFATLSSVINAVYKITISYSPDYWKCVKCDQPLPIFPLWNNVKFCQIFFCIFQDNHMIFFLSFILVMWYMTLTDLVHLCISLDHSEWHFKCDVENGAGFAEDFFQIYFYQWCWPVIFFLVVSVSGFNSTITLVMWS